MALTLVAAAGCVNAPGGAAPAFSLIDSEGNPLGLQDLAGKSTVLFFISALSCTSCEVETKKVLVPLHTEANGTVNFVSISMMPDESHDDLRTFKGKTGASWPHALDTDRVAQKYGVYALSTVVVISPEQQIVYDAIDPPHDTLKAKLGL